MNVLSIADPRCMLILALKLSLVMNSILGLCRYLEVKYNWFKKTEKFPEGDLYTYTII